MKVDFVDNFVGQGKVEQEEEIDDSGIVDADSESIVEVEDDRDCSEFDCSHIHHHRHSSQLELVFFQKLLYLYLLRKAEAGVSGYY